MYPDVIKAIYDDLSTNYKEQIYEILGYEF